MKPGEPVLAPGDVERRTRAARQASGVPLDDEDLVRPDCRRGNRSASTKGVRPQWRPERVHPRGGKMRKIVALAAGAMLVLVAGAWRRAVMAVEADQVGRAVRARRHDRHPRPHRRRETDHCAWSCRSSSRTSPVPAAGVGAEIVAKSAPDGYTIMGGTISTHAINASLYKEPAVRSGQGFRADHADRARPEHARRQSRRSRRRT